MLTLIDLWREPLPELIATLRDALGVAIENFGPAVRALEAKNGQKRKRKTGPKAETNPSRIRHRFRVNFAHLDMVRTGWPAEHHPTW